MGPDYLQNMLRYTCANTTPVLIEPRTNTSLGDRAFQNVGPRLWNSLPDDVRTCETLASFKITLKTHLFKEAHQERSSVS